jgi:hypothetical protein
MSGAAVRSFRLAEHESWRAFGERWALQLGVVDVVATDSANGSPFG